MKRILFFIVLIATLHSCNKEYYGKCEQVYDKHALPALDWNDYNDCDVVNTNFVYFTRGSNREWRRNPYRDNEGDIVKIKGYISHSYIHTFDSNSYYLDIAKDSLTAMTTGDASLMVVGFDKSDLNDIDLTKRCYITTIISFTPPHGLFLSGPIKNVKGCTASLPYFNIIEIKN